MKNLIRHILKEGFDDFDWVNDVNILNTIPNEKLVQLTEEEKETINYIFESEVYWSERYGCTPLIEITNVEFDEDDDWVNGVFMGIKRTIGISFTISCTNKNEITHLHATIDRDNLDDYEVA